MDEQERSGSRWEPARAEHPTEILGTHHPKSRTVPRVTTAALIVAGSLVAGAAVGLAVASQRAGEVSDTVTQQPSTTQAPGQVAVPERGFDRDDGFGRGHGPGGHR